MPSETASFVKWEDTATRHRRGKVALENHFYCYRNTRNLAHGFVTCNQWCPQRLGESEIGSIVSSHVGTKFPDSGKQEIMGVPPKRKLGKIR